MEYSIKELAELTGLTTRTLRYYDEINLLKPAIVKENGYRYYGSKELELLQQIMFYRKRGFELKQIKDIIENPDYDLKEALVQHLKALEDEKKNIDSLILNVKLTILSMEGTCYMTDKERFEVFKEEIIKENEAKYGAEIREKYGDETIDASNAKIMGMNEDKYNHFKSLEENIKTKLEVAVKACLDPSSDEGKEITALHKEWLMMTWKSYSSEAHKGLAKMYVFDERFKSYYDANVEGCAEFLEKAIEYWA